MTAVEEELPSAAAFFHESEFAVQSDRCRVPIDAGRVAFLEALFVKRVPKQDPYSILGVAVVPECFMDADPKAERAVFGASGVERDRSGQRSGQIQRFDGKHDDSVHRLAERSLLEFDPQRLHRCGKLDPQLEELTCRAVQ